MIPSVCSKIRVINMAEREIGRIGEMFQEFKNGDIGGIVSHGDVDVVLPSMVELYDIVELPLKRRRIGRNRSVKSNGLYFMMIFITTELLLLLKSVMEIQ